MIAPTVGLVWSDGSYLVLPEEIQGSTGYSGGGGIEIKVVWARPDRIGAVWDGYNNDWWEFDFMTGTKIQELSNNIAYLNPVWRGDKWIFERWRLADFYSGCGDNRRFWEDPPGVDVGLSNPDSAQTFFGLAVYREGKRAWVLAEGTQRRLAETSIDPFSCAYTYWSISGLPLVSIAYGGGVLYGATADDVYMLDPGGAHTLVWSGGGGNYLWVQNGAIFNINANAEIVGFDLEAQESFLYKALDSLPEYVNVFV